MHRDDNGEEDMSKLRVAYNHRGNTGIGVETNDSQPAHLWSCGVDFQSWAALERMPTFHEDEAALGPVNQIACEWPY